MRYLFPLGRLKRKLKTKRLFLFLDYDGTLAKIAGSPSGAFIDNRLKGLLRKLRGLPRCRVTIISGRELKDVKKMAQVEGITYAGNHGLQIQGAGLKFSIHINPDLKSAIRSLYTQLRRSLSHIKGVFVEDKGFGVAVHYRQAEKSSVSRVRALFRRIAHPCLSSGKIVLRQAKMALEAMPGLGWNKAKAVLWILSKEVLASRDTLVVYIGDDDTDEDAFKALKDKGLTIRVGKHKGSSAHYYLRNTQEVAGFLGSIVELRKA